MKRKTSRQLQAEHTKSHILDVVSEIMKEKNFEEMSIQEICRRAEISVGAFYHHFENKASLIVELYRDIDIFFLNEVMDLVREMEPVSAVIEYLVQQCKYASDLGCDIAKNVYKAQIDYGNDFFLSPDRGLPAGLLALVERAKKSGCLTDDVEPVLLTSQLLILARGIIYHWCVSGGKSDPQQLVRVMAEHYLKSCRK